jgi:hypothetical protein
VRILQHKKKTLQTRIGLGALAPASGSRLPLRRRESPENVPLLVLDQCQGGRVALAAAVKGACSEAIAAAPPQQRQALPAELREERRKVRGDQGSEGQRDGRGGRAGDGRGLEARIASTVAASGESVEESSATSRSRWAARSSTNDIKGVM